jgi:DedD protein
MDMEELEEKRPRFLWIIVVAVVAAVLTIFILVQSGRMKSNVAETRPAEVAQEEPATGPGGSAWPTPETALSEEPAHAAEAMTPPAAVETPVSKIEKAPEPAVKPTPVPESRPKPATEARKPESASRTGSPAVTETGRFVVQVGSYQDERIARIQAEKMENYGYRAWVESADIPGKGRFYRVRVGGFETLTDAEKTAESLSKTLGTRCWVDKR